jgi:hypothetical protein
MNAKDAINNINNIMAHIETGGIINDGWKAELLVIKYTLENCHVIPKEDIPEGLQFALHNIDWCKEATPDTGVYNVNYVDLRKAADAAALLVEG